MTHKSIGGWVIKNRLYAKAKMAGSLWYFDRKDGSGERQVSVFFIGWYEKAGPARLFTITVLWLSVQVGLVW